MMSHLENLGILTPDQHGFRKGLSTETQLLTAINDWAQELNHGGQTDVIFLDFSKAFDSVPHERLLEKLKYYGIRDKMNDTIRALFSMSFS